VLTKSSSKILFGKENSVGKTFLYIGGFNGKPEINVTVTAVVEDVPANSTIKFNALTSMSTLYAEKPTGLNLEEDWLNWGYNTYVLLKDQNVQTFKSKLSQLWIEQENKLWPESEHRKVDLIPLAETYFYNNNKRELIYLIQLVGIFILSIAIINFVNLTIAKSFSRVKEIGVRKVIGSLRRDLIKQFLIESILIAVITTPAALILFELCKNQFINIINKPIPLDILNQPSMILFLLGTVLITGLTAGIYPALVLSSFKSASILKGEKTKGKRGASLRFTLFVFQFVISVALIICTIFIFKQIEFLKTKSLGYSHENIIYCLNSREINKSYDVFKHKLLQNPGVISLTRSNHSLGQSLNISTGYEVNGVRKTYRATTVDPDFIPTMGIKVIQGRPFSWDIPTDKERSIIVNETFVKEFELENPIGTEIEFLDFLNFKPKIIGVIKDFHNSSFHQKIEPSALWYADWNACINIKISDQNKAQTISYIKNIWDELTPQVPFEYEFLDETYDKLYKAEEELKQIVSSFSLISIIITCFGLFGLISYNAVQRTKEIGIRKTLGASVADLAYLLARDYLKWIIIAVIIAFPVAYFVVDKWLQNFAYRIDISLWVFIFSGVIALLVALITVSYHVIKAATVNPAESLRYE
jgi:putative ABC transport system permease protein